jgi:hypothetical protein
MLPGMTPGAGRCDAAAGGRWGACPVCPDGGFMAVDNVVYLCSSIPTTWAEMDNQLYETDESCIHAETARNQVGRRKSRNRATSARSDIRVSLFHPHVRVPANSGNAG